MLIQRKITANIVKDILFDHCMAKKAGYRTALLEYYDEILKHKIASEDEYQNYVDARRIIAINWFKIIGFGYDLAQKTKISLKSLIELCKNPLTVKFFNFVSWSFKALFDLLKRAHKQWNAIFEAIAEYVEQYKVGRITADIIKGIDKWLKEHPKIKRLGGVAVAGLFIYAWLIMPYTLDIDFDFDSSEIVEGLSGNFSLYNIIAGSAGIKLISLFIVGSVITVAFPWSSYTAIPFLISIIYTLAKKAGIYVRKVRNEMELKEEAEQLERENAI